MKKTATTIASAAFWATSAMPAMADTKVSDFYNM
jgi:hypothetical protein